MLSLGAAGASKPHTVIFAKWTTVEVSNPESNLKPTGLKVRALSVDGRTKEFTTGAPHDVTERSLVVQRIYKMNDSLPQETGPARWQWQKGGWLLVDRVSGKIQQIVLPGFNPDSSAVSWFRDYAAYCGTSDDGRKLLAIIVQLGQRKPLLRKVILEGTNSEGDATPQACAQPRWDRNPTHATFEIADQKMIFAVKYRAAEAANEDEDSGSE
jgi:hypothetical protein